LGKLTSTLKKLDFENVWLDLGRICRGVGKSATNFVRNRLLGKLAQFWENWLGFRLFLGNNWLSFGVVLGQCSSLTVLNAEHVWVLIVEVQAPGVSKDGSTRSKLEGN
jgi:hypothetical protein